MGGTKRKIPIEKLEKKESRSVAFSKRRNGLYSKATELCRLHSGAQIAILATPPSHKSTVSFYSFGHPSVDAVVDAFLQNRRPQIAIADSASEASQVLKRERRREDGSSSSSSGLGLGFWWEKDFDEYENAKYLRDVIKGMTRLKNNVTLRLGTMKDQKASQIFQVGGFHNESMNSVVAIAGQKNITGDSTSAEIAVRNNNGFLKEVDELSRIQRIFER